MQQTAERTPKERVIFDENTYDEDYLRDYLHDDYEMYKDELEVSFDDYVRHRQEEGALYDIEESDWDEELSALTAFFDGEKSDMSSFLNPNGKNPIIVSGSIGRWNGTSQGMSAFDSFHDVLHGQDSPFKDCEIQKVWDENGHLYMRGAHHDGSVSVELRQLTDAGAAAYEQIAEAWVGEPFTIDGTSATEWASKTYDGTEQSVHQAMRDLWEEPCFAPLPRYTEQAFGTPAEEWQLDPLPLDLIGFSDEISECGDTLNFYIPVTFNPDRVFGTNVETFDNDDFLNIYVDYDMAHGEVADHLDLTLCRADGTDEYSTYPLDPAQRDALRQKMDAYCQKEVGKTLNGYVAELAAEDGQRSDEGRAGKSPVSLKSEAAASREAAQALSGNETHGNHGRDAR